MEIILRLVAFLGALAHVGFFYKEAIQWDVPFVKQAAPRWIKRAGGEVAAKPYVEWAKSLAINVGTYNLALAFGLAWLAFAGAAVAGTLGIFLSIWLLAAAAAAYHTKVKIAFYAQGGLGIVLLIASLATRH